MTTFGEIVEPVSRTAWEDWDNIVPEHGISELQWQKSIETPEEIDTFFIFEGKYLSDCIKTQTHYELEMINLIPSVNLYLYKIKASTKYICIIKDYNLVLSSDIVEMLKQYLSVSNDVIAIQTKSLSEYHSFMLAQSYCIIRTISTSKSLARSLDINFPKLEQPNIISGVSAGVICMREHLELTGMVLVCYTEYPEEYQIEEVQKLLEKINILQNTKSRPSSVLNSNLYI